MFTHRRHPAAAPLTGLKRRETTVDGHRLVTFDAGDFGENCRPDDRQFVRLEGAGTFLQLDRPQRLAELILEHVRKFADSRVAGEVPSHR